MTDFYLQFHHSFAILLVVVDNFINNFTYIGGVNIVATAFTCVFQTLFNIRFLNLCPFLVQNVGEGLKEKYPFYYIITLRV